MSETYEAGQVVAISNVLGPDLPSTSYFRRSENGNWYELSERMSGGMSTAEVFRLGDVTLLIPQSKIVHDGAASAPESAVDAPAAGIGESGSTEAAGDNSGRFLPTFDFDPAAVELGHHWEPETAGQRQASITLHPVPAVPAGPLWLLGHDSVGAPVILGTITNIEPIGAADAPVRPLVEKSWPAELFPDHPANHRNRHSMSTVSDGVPPATPERDLELTAAPGRRPECTNCGHRHSIHSRCSVHAVNCPDAACPTEPEVNRG